MSIQLVELPLLEWQNLRDLYIKKKQEPCSYSLIQNYINWKLKEPKMNIKMLVQRNNWRKNGTFVLIDFDMEMPHVYFNTLEHKTEELLEALSHLKMNTNYFLSTLPVRHLNAAKRYLLGNTSLLHNVKYFAGNWYQLSRESALKFDVRPPSDITLSALKLQYAEDINEAWPHKGPNTKKYVEKLINLNESVGAFDSNKNLVAWCLRTPLGALGNVQVLDTHRRLGLGSLLVRYMSKMLALKNEEIMAPVKYDNVASRTLFEKLGFVPVDEAFCMEIPNAAIINYI